MWNPGDNVALRGIFNGRVWLAQSVIVVKDSAEETILLLTPGAQCVNPDGWWQWRDGDDFRADRWTEMKNNTWALREFTWETNRLLMFLEPQKYYGTFYFWNQATDEFLCYYINFQLPYQRSHCGFDTLDLEIDLVIDPSFNWHWKDEDAYHAGIKAGCIQDQWVKEIKHAEQEILTKLRERRYPLDGSWLTWRPSANWNPPHLPERWQEVQ